MIIVTGAAGFIGSAIIAALNGRGIADILAVDDEGRGKCKNLENLRFSDFVGKEEFLKKVVEKKIAVGSKAVFHMGACSDTTETDVEYLRQNNLIIPRPIMLQKPALHIL